MKALPIPCQLRPAPADVQHIRTTYGLSHRDWIQLCSDEWRSVRAVVKPEYLTPATLPRSFHMLPYFQAHALHSPSDKRRQAARYARADIMEPYLRDDD